MTNIHIYRASFQPATDWSIDGVRVRRKPCALFRTQCCEQLRQARYVQIQAYYDGIYAWCADGHGCKKGTAR